MESIAAAAAQDRFIEFYGLLTGYSRDPIRTDFAKLESYLTGPALPIFRDSLIAMVGEGLAYRGNDDDPRVKVLSVDLPDIVVLSSCPLSSPTDPITQYTVANGQPVTTVPPAVPTPWLRTITMKISGGVWRVSDISVDSTKTCTV